MTDVCVTLSDWKYQNLCIVILNILAYKFCDIFLCVCVCVCVCMNGVTVQKGESSGRATPHVVNTDSTASNLTRAGESDIVILYR
jgi:hypothetical protein